MNERKPTSQDGRLLEVERDAALAQVQQLEDELAAARVQMRRDTSHMALCKGVVEGARETRNHAHLLQGTVRRLTKELKAANAEVTDLKAKAGEISTVTSKDGRQYAYPDPEGGPSELRLHCGARGGTVPVGDLIHARHEDTGCWNCADNHKCHRALVKENERLLAAYDELQKGLFLLVRPYREPGLFAAPTPDLPTLLSSLDKLSDRGGRIRRGD